MQNKNSINKAIRKALKQSKSVSRSIIHNAQSSYGKHKS